MSKIRALILFSLTIASSAMAIVMGNTPVTLDFTTEESAAKDATRSAWLDVMGDGSGLGSDLMPNGTRDVWIQSRPIGLGRAWRPCQSANFIVKLSPAIEAKTMGSSGYAYPGLGNLFVRHSIDLRTWSSWQAVTFDFQSAVKGNVTRFTGTVATPMSERADYEKRLREFFRMDVPWTSDEEDLMTRIIAEDPTYLERQTPFIGYVQFRYEFNISADQRVKKLEIDFSWTLGGAHQPPNDPELAKLKRGPWRFRHPELSP